MIRNWLLILFLFVSCRRIEDINIETISFPPFEESMEYIEHDIFIPSGGSLFSELTKYGLTHNQIVELTLVFGANIDFRAIQPNDHFRLFLDAEDGTIVEFHYLPDIVTTHRIIRDIENQTYQYHLEEKEITRKKIIHEGIVYTTFVQAMADNNIERNLRYSVANALSSRINFSGHTRPGDTYKIMYEERYFEETRLPGATLFYVSYNGRATGFHEGFRYSEDDEKSVFNGMYTPQGVAMVTANYRHPLDRIHVSSPYGMRIHPITRRRAMHNGVDYRAPQGTPVYAVQAGRIIMAGWNGGFGNTVEIQHENNYVTQYAHLHRISVRQGQRVSRGTVIGSVGSTGFSTGAHLHFGLRVAGRWVNPSQLRMVSAIRLEGRRLEDFNKQIPEIRNMLYLLENATISPFDLTEFEKYRRVNAIIQ